jgi:beta-glucosidase
MSDSNRFPAGFLWGAATSAYQVEGSPLADGAGPSNWHQFAHTHGMTANGETGDVACDHYNRSADDVALMAELGLNAYRFSINWSRVLPEGTGAVNPKGLAFYDRLVDQLLARNIKPNATLFHWDLPAALEQRGGWLNRDSAGWFSDYASHVVQTLGDRVAMWATLNEPWVVTDGGYLFGVLAPGHRSIYETPIASHNLLRAHGAGMQAIRAAGGKQAGLVVNLEPKYRASNSPEDLAATARVDAYMNRQYLDPVFHGRYPRLHQEIFGDAWPSFPAADFDLIRQPLDFLGINYYTRSVNRHDPTNWPFQAARVRQPQHTHTLMEWEVYAQALTDLLLWVKQEYPATPLFITENGAAFYDPPTATEGRIDDPLRVAYYRDHLRAIRSAMAQGVDLRGYFAWSLLDNFEWSAGYAKRFGLIHVDFATQQRTIKQSGRFYSDIIKSNGASL